ncbi:MAG: hypothetical protein AAGI37_05635 [Planctomycetota bacterium]
MRHPSIKGILAALAFVCVAVSFVSSLGIWIYFFDHEGGEPGAQTIFGSIPLLPGIALLAVAAAVGSYRSIRVFIVVASLTAILICGAVVTTLLSRAENAEQSKTQLVKMGQAESFKAN